ncbi:hypothetical protein PM082_017235 [Marasmius tenuissimus]|nr:hypothetical protein PM082_017235 [Marasmius tenuissimus]
MALVGTSLSSLVKYYDTDATMASAFCTGICSPDTMKDSDIPRRYFFLSAFILPEQVKSLNAVFPCTSFVKVANNIPAPSDQCLDPAPNYVDMNHSQCLIYSY